MDELDSTIVRILQKDGRATNRELAAKLKVAPSTSLERLRSLREREVIKGFHADVDLYALNRHVQAMISVQVRPQSRAVIQGIVEFVGALPETLAVYVVAGEDDILIHVGVQGTAQLQDFVLDQLTKRTEISGINTSVIYQHRRNAVLAALPEPKGGEH